MWIDIVNKRSYNFLYMNIFLHILLSPYIIYIIAITNLPPRAMMGIDSCGMLISAVHHENGEEKLHLLMVDPHIPAGAKLY